MGIVEYYHALVQLDWYSSWSDDPQTYWAGEVGYEALHVVALNNGPPFAWLMTEYKKRLFSGKPWGSEPLPMLTVPDAPTMDVTIDLRPWTSRPARQQALPPLPPKPDAVPP